MFVVQGGRQLTGRVAVSGAKNAALPIMAAALVADGPSVLTSVPDLVDVQTLGQLLTTLGMRVTRAGSVGRISNPSEKNRDDKLTDGLEIRPTQNALTLEVIDDRPCIADYELVRKMRAGICVLGPLLARRGRACVSLPGGCNIGDRPVDLHLKGLTALGANIRIERGYIIAEARRLRGAAIYLGGAFGSTVTGTCNVMTAATLADGVTTIEAAACEPEVIDLGEYLNKMGARITGLGTPFLRIEGVDKLHGVRHEIIPDRIEAVTLMIAAAMTRGDVRLDNVRLDHLTAVLEKLREIGVRIEPVGDACCGAPPHPLKLFFKETGWTQSVGWAAPANADSTEAKVEKRADGHSPPYGPTSVQVTVPVALCESDCIMLPYPGLPTDVQAQFMALVTGASGISIITDKVFPDRFMHAPELVRMGARIRREGPSAIISGVPSLSGASVMASDLRASAALVLASLAAKGESVVRRIYHLDRGYDRLENKLNELGAGIRRIADTPENMPASLSPKIAVPVAAGDHDLRGPKWVRAGSGQRSAVSGQPSSDVASVSES